MIATRSEDFANDADGPDRRIDNRSNVPVSITDTLAPSPKQAGQRGKSLGIGTCLLLLLVSGLIRTAINSHVGDQRGQASRASKRQIELSTRQFSESFRNMPTWQRALMKLNLSQVLIETDPKNAEWYNDHARILATYTDNQFRKSAEWELEHRGAKDHASIKKRAVDDATKACELSEWKTPAYLDTLGAAYANSGDFDSAVKWETKARDLAPEKDKSACQSRLDLYKAHKPYREEPKN
jgi:hypothetical protein